MLLKKGFFKFNDLGKGRKSLIFLALSLLTLTVLLLQLTLNPLAYFSSPAETKTLPASTSGQDSAAKKAQASQDFANSPISFEPSAGSTGDQPQFFARGKGYTFALSATEAVFTLARQKVSQTDHVPANFSSSNLKKLQEMESSAANNQPPATVRMTLGGANPNPELVGQQEQTSKTNYFLGNDQTKWRTNVTNYGQVLYKEVYPGTDLVYYGNSQNELEYDFNLAPGADPSAIALNFEGVTSLGLNANGDLILHLPDGDITQHAPVIYQQKNGVKTSVTGRYVFSGEKQVKFEVGAYDKSLPLVIDPTLFYSTYLGGSVNDTAISVAVDTNGAVYVTGNTGDTYNGEEPDNFPTKNAYDSTFNGGLQDIFVAKFNADGSLAWSTYLGSPDDDYAYNVSLDSTGAAYISGANFHGGFPTKNAYDPSFNGVVDGVLTKFDSTGGLVFSTYIGGNNIDGVYYSVVRDNVLIVSGATNSTDFLTTVGDSTNSSIVLKFTLDGQTLLYSSRTSSPVGDPLGKIVVDSTGASYNAGYYDKDDYPVTPGAAQPTRSGQTDVVVTKFDSAGNVVYSTYLGGSNFEYLNRIAVTSDGSLYLVGYTQSSDFPKTMNAVQSTLKGLTDGFIAKLSPTGALTYSTYFGGSDDDYIYNAGMDGNGALYVSGITRSNDFPVLHASQPKLGTYDIYDTNGQDGFVTKFNPDNTLAYSTYFGGGSNSDEINSMVVQSNGTVVIVGDTAWDPFDAPIKFPIYRAFQPHVADRTDAFVAKLKPLIVLDTATQSALQTALTQAGNLGGADVFFADNVTAITLTSDLAIPAGVSLVGSCGENGPNVTFNGSGIVTLQGNTQLTGVLLNGLQLTNEGGGPGNLLNCVVVHRVPTP